MEKPEVRVPACRIWTPPESIDLILNDFREILETGQVILGRWTDEFEAGWAHYCNRRHGIAVNSDTAAMEIQWKVWKLLNGWNDGDYVVLPATSFFSCATGIRNAGLTPVVCDASAEAGIFPTLEQFLEKAEDLNRDDIEDEDGVRPKLVAFLAVYAGGYIGGDIESIIDWCHANGVKVMEDAAHCHGATLNGVVAGAFGDSSAWSFYATKVLNTHEGGMLLTDSLEEAEMARVFRNYGRVSDFGRSLAKYEGYNWRMSEMHARLGVDQVQRADDVIARRRERAGWYDEEMAIRGLFERFGVQKLAPPDGCVPNYYRYIVMLGERSNEVNVALREFLKAECWKHGVQLAGEVYEATLNCQPIFSDLGVAGDFPMAEAYCAGHVCLPINNDGDAEEVGLVMHAFEKALMAAQAAGFLG